MHDNPELFIALVFLIGLTVGIVATMLFNKAKGGHATAHAVKKDMEDYQGKVEEHFDSTARKFKDLAGQYQDLYEHMSKGAVDLCRPENLTPVIAAPEENKERVAESISTSTQGEESDADKNEEGSKRA